MEVTKLLNLTDDVISAIDKILNKKNIHKKIKLYNAKDGYEFHSWRLQDNYKKFLREKLPFDVYDADYHLDLLDELEYLIDPDYRGLEPNPFERQKEIQEEIREYEESSSLNLKVQKLIKKHDYDEPKYKLWSVLKEPNNILLQAKALLDALDIAENKTLVKEKISTLVEVEFTNALQDAKIYLINFRDKLFDEKNNYTQPKETIMGDKIEIHGNIETSGGQVFLANKFKGAFNNLENSGHQELAAKLENLTEAILASEELDDSQKEEYSEVTYQITEEIAKEKPNKTIIRMLGEGLLEGLKLVPSLAETVMKVAPLITKLF